MIQRISSIIALALTALLFIGGFVLFRSCHPAPAPIPLQVSASVSALSTSAASQSIKITIRRPSTFQNTLNTTKTRQNSSDTETPQLQTKPMPLSSPPSLLKRLALVIRPANKQIGLPAPQNSPSATVANNATVGEVITIEVGQSMASSGSGEASASAIAPNITQNAYSSIGIIAGTLPGIIALDWRAIHLGPIGLDLAANHRSVSVGISAGGKFFGLAGGYQGFDGGRGYFAGAGVRF